MRSASALPSCARAPREGGPSDCSHFSWSLPLTPRLSRCFLPFLRLGSSCTADSLEKEVSAMEPLPQSAPACGIAVLIVASACFVYFNTTRKDNRNAPADPSKPFTIMFTDIQASTMLWAALPQRMGKAIDLHHATIRKLIRAHNGYEVKTIGDAFMIAFTSASDALDLGS